eukprot:gnl/Dysnectes_brevis/5054_a7100_712.p1 GENE.gnl/Dysnectes_brevis/5054_a7100_712~~gnl/Dysnectes_brevis/5054_a7100_712.p1  ORF type:complete len:468 (-),score=64.92 gnl/Dysnectes_brevis/5054_a7100_712:55-1458(-)
MSIVDDSWSSIFGKAIPSLLQLSIDPLASLVVISFIGNNENHTDDENSISLAAFSFSTSIINTLAWIFNFLLSGVTAKVSRAISTGNIDEVRSRIGLSIKSALICGVSSSITLALLMPLLFELGSLDEVVREQAKPFYLIISATAPLILLFRASVGVLNGLGFVRSPLIGQLLVSGPYVLLTWCSVQTGKELTAVGVSYATGYAISCLVLVPTVLRRRPRRSETPPTSGTLKAQSREGGAVSIIDFVRESADLLVRSCCLQLTLFLSSILAANIGADATAAYGILSQLWVLQSQAVDGFAVASNMIASSLLGRPKGTPRSSDLLRLFYRVLAVSAVLGVAFAAVLGVMPYTILGWFTSDQSVVDVAVQAWPVLVIAQMINALTFGLDGFLFALGDFKFIRKAFLWMLVVFFVTLIPFYWYRSLFFILGAQLMSNLFRAIVSGSRTLIQARKIDEETASESLPLLSDM